jgi:predicted nucleic acid-binding protein
MGLDIIGLLGILILNLKKNLISNREALVILEEIKGLKFRISQKLEESFLNMIGL